MKLQIEYKGQKIKYPLCKQTFCYKWIFNMATKSDDSAGP